MASLNKYNVNLILIPALGWNIGHIVAVKCARDMVSILRGLGLNVDKGDKFGWTARQLSKDLHGIDIFESQDTAESTAETTTDNNVQNTNHITELHVAAISGKPQPIFDFIKKEKDLSVFFVAKDCFGFTPMDYLERLHHDGDYYKRLIEIELECRS